MAKRHTQLVEVSHLDDQGNGWLLVQPTVEQISALIPHLPSHPAQGGYKNTAEMCMQQYDEGVNHTLIGMTDAAARGSGTFWLKWTTEE